MNIETTVTVNNGNGNITLTLTGEAYAENWCAEFSDWDVSHITLTEIRDGYNSWGQEFFTETELRFFRLELWKASRAKSAPQPFVKLNIRNLLNLPAQ